MGNDALTVCNAVRRRIIHLISKALGGTVGYRPGEGQFALDWMPQKEQGVVFPCEIRLLLTFGKLWHDTYVVSEVPGCLSSNKSIGSSL